MSVLGSFILSQNIAPTSICTGTGWVSVASIRRQLGLGKPEHNTNPKGAGLVFRFVLTPDQMNRPEPELNVESQPSSDQGLAKLNPY